VKALNEKAAEAMQSKPRKRPQAVRASVLSLRVAPNCMQSPNVRGPLCRLCHSPWLPPSFPFFPSAGGSAQNEPPRFWKDSISFQPGFDPSLAGRGDAAVSRGDPRRSPPRTTTGQDVSLRLLGSLRDLAGPSGPRREDPREMTRKGREGPGAPGQKVQPAPGALLRRRTSRKWLSPCWSKVVRG